MTSQRLLVIFIYKLNVIQTACDTKFVKHLFGPRDSPLDWDPERRLTVAGGDLAEVRTCSPQTDTERQDRTLQWPRSDGWNPPVRQTHPTRSMAAVTTAPLVTGWRTSCCEGLRMEDRPWRGGLIYEPESRWRHSRPRTVDGLPAASFSLCLPACCSARPPSSVYLPACWQQDRAQMTYHPPKKLALCSLHLVGCG